MEIWKVSKKKSASATIHTNLPLVMKATYIMGGGNLFPSKVSEKVVQTGGELAHNLLLLDKATVITTSQGIRIAALGGGYDPASYGSPKYVSKRSNFLFALLLILVHLKSYRDSNALDLGTCKQLHYCGHA